MSSTTARPPAAVAEGIGAVKTSAATNAPAARLRKNLARLGLGQPVWIESMGRSAFALCALYNHYLADFASPERLRFLPVAEATTAHREKRAAIVAGHRPMSASLCPLERTFLSAKASCL